MSRDFKWNAWDFDGDGEAYIIAKDECLERENVPEYIIKEDGLSPGCKDGMKVEEGWCKFQVRSDWDDGEGETRGWYVVETYEPFTKNIYGKRKPGWFPVWIVRKDEWY
jgi:hypothetical protein